MKTSKTKNAQLVVAIIRFFITLFTYFSMLPFPSEINTLFIMIAVFTLSRFFTIIESLLNNGISVTIHGKIELFVSVILSVMAFIIGMNNSIPCKDIIAVIAYLACGYFLIKDTIEFFSVSSHKNNVPQPQQPSLLLEEE